MKSILSIYHHIISRGRDLPVCAPNAIPSPKRAKKRAIGTSIGWGDARGSVAIRITNIRRKAPMYWTAIVSGNEDESDKTYLVKED